MAFCAGTREAWMPTSSLQGRIYGVPRTERHALLTPASQRPIAHE